MRAEVILCSFRMLFKKQRLETTRIWQTPDGRSESAEEQENLNFAYTNAHTHNAHCKIMLPNHWARWRAGNQQKNIHHLYSLSLYIYVSINHHVEYIYVSILTAGTLPTWPTCFKHATHPGGGLTNQTAWQHMATEDRSAQSQHFFFTSGNPQN